jgi:hypothetical protein
MFLLFVFLIIESERLSEISHDRLYLGQSNPFVYLLSIFFLKETKRGTENKTNIESVRNIESKI